MPTQNVSKKYGHDKIKSIHCARGVKMRIVYIYQKYNEDDADLQRVAKSILHSGDQMMFGIEHPDSFQVLDDIINKEPPESIIIVHDIRDIGINAKDVTDRLSKIIKRKIVLLIVSVPATYEHGVSSKANGIVLDTLCQIITQSKKDTITFRPRPAGRPKTEFPSGWDEKYEDWKIGRISSKEFMDWSGLKKATFYNRIADYQRILAEDEAENQKQA